MKFDHRHYVPVLKGKRGEFDGLERLESEARPLVTPLLEVAPIPWDYAEDRVAKTVDDHLAGTTRQLVRAWGPGEPIFVDLRFIDDGERLANGTHPVVAVFGELNAAGVEGVPATSLDADGDFQDAVRSIENEYQNGVCVRLAPDDLVDLAALAAGLAALLERLKVTHDQCDLVVDLGEVPAENSAAALIMAGAVLPQLPALDAWRSLTLVGGSFPADLSSIETSSIDTIRRADWLLWKALVERDRPLPRLPAFGDYAISHMEPFDADPRLIRPSSNIRYTAGDGFDHWVIVKGRSLRHYGFSQYHEDAGRLMSRREWRGHDHCWGCENIAGCAARTLTSGNQTTWRAVGTNHHIATVTEQIAGLA